MTPYMTGLTRGVLFGIAVGLYAINAFLPQSERMKVWLVGTAFMAAQMLIGASERPGDPR